MKSGIPASSGVARDSLTIMQGEFLPRQFLFWVRSNWADAGQATRMLELAWAVKVDMLVARDQDLLALSVVLFAESLFDHRNAIYYTYVYMYTYNNRS